MRTIKLLCLSATALTLAARLVQAGSPGTAFTYQGRLFDGGVPANGLYDLQFTNYNAATGGNALGAFNTNALPVTNGLFTVALDFGAVFDGTPRWLEISERTNGVGIFATLAPRQYLAAAPYATYAASAGTAGAVPGLTILQNASGAPNVIAGSPWNFVGSGVVGATIGGGGATTYGGHSHTNSVSVDFGTIGGGYDNAIQTSALSATISGGSGNTIQTNDWEATIGGGEENTIQTGSEYATIGGGLDNTIQADAINATIPGGSFTLAAASYSFAAGNQAMAIHTGAFVWADSTAANFSSTANDQFAVRASGGVFFQLGGANATIQANETTGYPDAKQLVIQGNTNPNRQLELGYKTADSSNYGVIQAIEQNVGFRPLVLQPSGGNVGIGTTTPGNLLVVGNSGSPAYCNGTSWVNGSDRNSKEAFRPINPRAVLEKVSALPITQWKYNAEADGTEHLGPMAQDFHAAFGLNGPDDKHIATVDEEGVALAAIQGLNQKLEETRADNAALRADNADLRARLEKLECLLQPSK